MNDQERYRRHLALREVGAIGQARIRAGAVRVTGVGPAAEEAAFYLVAAGVGRVLLEAGLTARHGERLSELNPGVELASGAVDAVEVKPHDELRRADGARAALVALLRLSAAADVEVWRDDSPSPEAR